MQLLESFYMSCQNRIVFLFIVYHTAMKKLPDPFVITKKTVLMQRLADLVRSGHREYVFGSIPLDQAARLAGKFDQLYRVDQTRLEASRQRKEGHSSFRLLLLLQENGDAPQVLWWLLRTAGTGPAEAEREKWRDANKDRIELTGYELVRQPRPGKATAAWTWRYTKEREADLRDTLVHAIRTKRDAEVRQLIHTIWRTPGFAAARAQVKKMGQLIEGEWKRSRPKEAEAMPEIPARLGYVRRLANVGATLSTLSKSKK